MNTTQKTMKQESNDKLIMFKLSDDQLENVAGGNMPCTHEAVDAYCDMADGIRRVFGKFVAREWMLQYVQSDDVIKGISDNGVDVLRDRLHREVARLTA